MEIPSDLYGDPIEIKTRKCKKCGEVLPLEMFGIDKMYADGRRPECKKCRSTLTKDSKYFRTTIPIPENHVCYICMKTEEQLIEEQNHEDKERSVWRADHDHDTKEFRGYICDNCNKAAGLIKTVESAERLVKYLKGEFKMEINTLELETE